MNLSTMPPNHHHFMLHALPMEPVSRTYQYRKIMKPMLERKRRARINKCLDELKDLMTGTLQADGENVSKLEKADILELTVRHLQRLREHNTLFLRSCNNSTNSGGGGGGGNGAVGFTSNNNLLNTEKFWAGFQHCATEVSQFLSQYDRNISGELIKHIVSYMPNLNTTAATITAQSIMSSTAAPAAQSTISCPPPPPAETTTSTAAARTAAAAAITTAILNQRCIITTSEFNKGTIIHRMQQQQQQLQQQQQQQHYYTRDSDYAKVKLHPYARKHVESSDGVWRPW